MYIKMELEYEHESEETLMITLEYCKPVRDSKKICVCCVMDESPLKWDKYELPCGHEMHTRCFRKWTDEKGCMNCPLCRDIPMTKENIYCDSCDKRGHGKEDCPKFIECMRELARYGISIE